MKNSESFKSFEEKVGGAYENVKVCIFHNFHSILENSKILKILSRKLENSI